MKEKGIKENWKTVRSEAEVGGLTSRREPSTGLCGNWLSRTVPNAGFLRGRNRGGGEELYKKLVGEKR